MRVKLYSGLRKTAEHTDITQTVIYDDFNQPIALITSPANGVVISTTINDKDFAESLHKLGLAPIGKGFNG